MKIVICAAGIGSRLGHGIPKCLAKISGKALIRRQLKILTPLGHEIAVVIGYKKEIVLEEMTDFQVGVVANDNYPTTSVMDSVRLGVGESAGDILVVDGDVLFRPEDIRSVINYPGNVVCITKNISTAGQIYSTTKDGVIVSFSRTEKTELEWAGICKLKAEQLRNSQEPYIYQVLERHLPLPYLEIDSAEIDTPQDLERAETWIKRE